MKKYLLRIFDKLGVSNRVELVLYALTQREMKTQEGDSDREHFSAGARTARKEVVADVSERDATPGKLARKIPSLSANPV